MKKISIVFLALLLAGGLVAALEGKPFVSKGDSLFQVGIGYGGLAAGYEYDFAEFKLGPIPLTFGAAARVAVDPGIFNIWGVQIGAGAYGMGHISLAGLNLPSSMRWVENTDTYLGLGLGLGALISANYPNTKPGISFNWLVGESYYLNKKLALYAEYGYCGAYTYDGLYAKTTTALWYATVGAVMKI